MKLRPSLFLISGLALAAGGCAQAEHRPDYAELASKVRPAAHRSPGPIPPDEPTAAALDPTPPPPELLGPQPVDAFIRRALAENRSVQAARYNLLALKARLPQV